MIKILKKRLSQEEEGFTLIELMVVLLIIAILMLIAIPTFLGARTKAQNRGAQSDLRNALTAEKTAYTSGSKYVAAGTGVLSKLEPSLKWTAGAPSKTVANQVEALASTTGNTTCLYAQSASGTYYGMADIATGTGAGTYFITLTGAPSATCDAAAITPVSTTNPPPAGSWSTSSF